MNQLTRREFLQRAAILGLSASAIVLLDGCGILPAPTPTPAKIPRIGILFPGSRSLDPEVLAIFVQAFRDLGYVEGQNIVIEWRFAEGEDERFPDYATELVRLKVDVILAISINAILAARKATETIPIVTFGPDPVDLGIAASYAHPGGNVTGVTLVVKELYSKQIELLKAAVPSIIRMAYFGRANGIDPIALKEATTLAANLGVRLQSEEVASPVDFDRAFNDVTRGQADAFVIFDNPIFYYQRTRIFNFAAENRLPAMYGRKEYAEGGGLISYGVNFAEVGRRAVAYVDKILKGAKPADLPIEHATKFDFVINLKTMKALGLTIPQSILAQATEVIQ